MLKLSELFLSIQGESTQVGLPTVFVRCAGCNLSCSYCDTEYARTGGIELSCTEVLKRVEVEVVKRVTITGGEPLLQKEAVGLSAAFAERGYDVQIETNGSLDISVIPQHVRIIMDIKTPGSEMSEKNDYTNLDRLKKGDELKFVITSYDDYTWALDMIRSYDINRKRGIEVIFSPASGVLKPQDLAEWIINDKIGSVRLQIGLHRVLWNGERGR
jgi:7-carboxy-7-deazaguanine synthase